MILAADEHKDIKSASAVYPLSSSYPQVGSCGLERGLSRNQTHLKRAIVCGNVYTPQKALHVFILFSFE